MREREVDDDVFFTRSTDSILIFKPFGIVDVRKVTLLYKKRRFLARSGANRFRARRTDDSETSCSQSFVLWHRNETYKTAKFNDERRNDRSGNKKQEIVARNSLWYSLEHSQRSKSRHFSEYLFRDWNILIFIYICIIYTYIYKV